MSHQGQNSGSREASAYPKCISNGVVVQEAHLRSACLLHLETPCGVPAVPDPTLGRTRDQDCRSAELAPSRCGAPPGHSDPPHGPPAACSLSPHPYSDQLGQAGPGRRTRPAGPRPRAARARPADARGPSGGRRSCAGLRRAGRPAVNHARAELRTAGAAAAATATMGPRREICG